MTIAIVPRRAAALAAAALWLLVRAPAHADTLTDPDQIYRAARKAWSFTNFSRYATYTVAIRFRNAAVKVTRHYDTIEDTRRGIVFSRTFSREEIANPSIPHGINVQVGSINGQGGVKANEEPTSDPVGPLALAATYDFGISLVPQKTTVVSSTRDIEFPPSLPIIGTTAVAAHDYDVRLIEMLDAGKTYHLGLKPLRDPGRLRLREMWVTADTFTTKRILIDGNYTDEPFTRVPWVIEFRQIGGAQYISREIAEAPLDFPDKVMLPNVTVDFEELTLLDALPRYGAVGANDSSKAMTEP